LATEKCGSVVVSENLRVQINCNAMRGFDAENVEL
jgi:hypothetical protein